MIDYNIALQIVENNEFGSIIEVVDTIFDSCSDEELSELNTTRKEIYDFVDLNEFGSFYEVIDKIYDIED